MVSRLVSCIVFVALINISDAYSCGGGQNFGHLDSKQLQKSTAELYSIAEPKFYGKYKNSRKGVDYSYHKYYRKDRQLFQDSLIEKYLKTGMAAKNPIIIFTAGPMGVGKSFTLHHLSEQGIMDLSSYIWVDPDQVKLELPEKDAFQNADPIHWASQLHAESVFIQEIIFSEALKLKKNIIVDRSFRGADWHKKLFVTIRKEHPEYSIEILQVVADFSA